MTTRRLYDPDHCTACGDFLPCGDSWIKDADNLPDKLATDAQLIPSDSERLTELRDGLRHRIAYHDGDVDAERMVALLDRIQLLEGELEAARMVSDMAEDDLARRAVEHDRMAGALADLNYALAEAERDYERATELADERFAAANVLHAKWQDAESRIERVRVDLDFIIGAYMGPPIPHEAIAIVLDMVDARLRAGQL